jgi:hypothetical protein
MLSVGSITGVFGYGLPLPHTVFQTSAPSILAFARQLLAGDCAIQSPIFGGPLCINDARVGGYEYAIRPGETVDAEWDESLYFGENEDAVSAWVLFKGSATIEGVFRPSRRKLFTVVYVAGDLVLNGCISMSARGARHTRTPPVDIRLYEGTLSECKNPSVPAFGGCGGAARSTFGSSAGAAGCNGGSGGGGGGMYGRGGGCGTVGAGSGGTCFSGGSGSGSMCMEEGAGASGEGRAFGGEGGDGAAVEGGTGCGGAGNPGGRGFSGIEEDSDLRGGEGTGGTLIVIVEGAIITNTDPVKRFIAEGVNGASYGALYGGGSGGGSIIVFSKTEQGALPRMSATGGGNGGAGSARHFTLP